MGKVKFKTALNLERENDILRVNLGTVIIGMSYLSSLNALGFTRRNSFDK